MNFKVFFLLGLVVLVCVGNVKSIPIPDENAEDKVEDKAVEEVAKTDDVADKDDKEIAEAVKELEEFFTELQKAFEELVKSLDDSSEETEADEKSSSTTPKPERK